MNNRLLYEQELNHILAEFENNDFIEFARGFQVTIVKLLALLIRMKLDEK